jgi:hypothetical protein
MPTCFGTGGNGLGVATHQKHGTSLECTNIHEFPRPLPYDTPGAQTT